MKVKITNYENSKEILKFRDHYVGVAVMVKDTGVSANSDGKKIVLAGTLVSGTTVGGVSKDNGTTTEGVLLSDVDVTHGEAPGTMIIHGFINADKMPETATAAAKAALPMIKFV